MGNISFKAVCVILLLAAVAGVIGGCTSNVSPEGKSREVAALVNGASIYLDDVNNEYISLSPEQRSNITKADALSFLIEREVLFQRALEEKITATADEISQEYGHF